MVDYVLTGLVKRRAELAGEIEATHARLRKLMADIERLDAAILQFDPDYKLESIRPRAFRLPKDCAERGDMTRIVLDILRQASEPLITRDIAIELLTQRRKGSLSRSPRYAGTAPFSGSAASATQKVTTARR